MKFILNLILYTAVFVTATCTYNLFSHDTNDYWHGMNIILLSASVLIIGLIFSVDIKRDVQQDTKKTQQF